MMKTYLYAQNLMTRLRNDKNVAVSFEYLLVAFCVVTSVGFAFGSTTGGAIATALKNKIAEIVTLLG
jgi:hypothetical protein